MSKLSSLKNQYSHFITNQRALFLFILLDQASKLVVSLVRPQWISIFSWHPIFLRYSQLPLFSFIRFKNAAVPVFFILFFILVLGYYLDKTRLRRSHFIDGLLLSIPASFLIDIITRQKLAYVGYIRTFNIEFNFSAISMLTFITLVLYQQFIKRYLQHISAKDCYRGIKAYLGKVISKESKGRFLRYLAQLNSWILVIEIVVATFITIYYITTLLPWELHAQLVISAIMSVISGVIIAILKSAFIRSSKQGHVNKNGGLISKLVMLPHRIYALLLEKFPVVSFLVLALAIYPIIKISSLTGQKINRASLKEMIVNASYDDEMLSKKLNLKSDYFRLTGPIYIDYAENKAISMLPVAKFDNLLMNLKEKVTIVKVPPEVNSNILAKEIAFRLSVKGIKSLSFSCRNTREIGNKDKVLRSLKRADLALIIEDAQYSSSDIEQLLRIANNRIICIERSEVIPQYANQISAAMRTTPFVLSEDIIEPNSVGHNEIVIGSDDVLASKKNLLKQFRSGKLAPLTGPSDMRTLSRKLDQYLCGFPIMELYLILKYFYDDDIQYIDDLVTLKEIIKKDLMSYIIATDTTSLYDKSDYLDCLYIISLFNKYSLFVRNGFLTSLYKRETIDAIESDSRLGCITRDGETYLSFNNIGESNIFNEYLSNHPEYCSVIRKYVLQGQATHILDIDFEMALILKYLELFPSEINIVLPALLFNSESRNWLAVRPDLLNKNMAVGIRYPSTFSREALYIYLSFGEPRYINETIRATIKDPSSNKYVKQIAQKERDFIEYLSFINALSSSAAHEIVNNKIEVESWIFNMRSYPPPWRVSYLKTLQYLKYKNYDQVTKEMRKWAPNEIGKLLNGFNLVPYLKQIEMKFDDIPEPVFMRILKRLSPNDIISLLGYIKSTNSLDIRNIVNRLIESGNKGDHAFQKDLIVRILIDPDLSSSLETPLVYSFLVALDGESFVQLICGEILGKNQLMANAVNRIPEKILLNKISEYRKKHPLDDNLLVMLWKLDEMLYPHLVKIIESVDLYKLASRQWDKYSDNKELYFFINKYIPSQLKTLEDNKKNEMNSRQIDVDLATPAEYIALFKNISRIEVIRRLIYLYNSKYSDYEILLNMISCEKVVADAVKYTMGNQDIQAMMDFLWIAKEYGVIRERDLNATLDQQARLIKDAYISLFGDDDFYGRMFRLRNLASGVYDQIIQNIEENDGFRKKLRVFLDKEEYDNVLILLSFIKEIKCESSYSIVNDTDWTDYGFESERETALLLLLKQLKYARLHEYSIQKIRGSAGIPFLMAMQDHLRLGFSHEDLFTLECKLIHERLSQASAETYSTGLSFLEYIGYFEKSSDRTKEYFAECFNIPNALSYIAKNEDPGHPFEIILLLDTIKSISPEFYSRLLFALKDKVVAPYEMMMGSGFDKNIYYGTYINNLLDNNVSLSPENERNIEDIFYVNNSHTYCDIIRKMAQYGRLRADILPSKERLIRSISAKEIGIGSIYNLVSTLVYIKYPRINDYLDTLDLNSIIGAFDSNQLAETYRLIMLFQELDKQKYRKLRLPKEMFSDDEIIWLINTSVKDALIVFRYIGCESTQLRKLFGVADIHKISESLINYAQTNDLASISELRRLGYPIANIANNIQSEILRMKDDYNADRAGIIAIALKHLQKEKEFSVLSEDIGGIITRDRLVKTYFTANGFSCINNLRSLLKYSSYITADELLSSLSDNNYRIEEFNNLIQNLINTDYEHIEDLLKRIDYLIINHNLLDAERPLRKNLFNNIAGCGDACMQLFISKIDNYIIADTYLNSSNNYINILHVDQIHKITACMQINDSFLTDVIARCIDAGDINCESLYFILSLIRDEGVHKDDILRSLLPTAIFCAMHTQTPRNSFRMRDLMTTKQATLGIVKKIMLLLNEIRYPYLPELASIFSRNHIQEILGVTRDENERIQIRSLFINYSRAREKPAEHDMPDVVPWREIIKQESLYGASSSLANNII